MKRKSPKTLQASKARWAGHRTPLGELSNGQEQGPDPQTPALEDEQADVNDIDEQPVEEEDWRRLAGAVRAERQACCCMVICQLPGICCPAQSLEAEVAGMGSDQRLRACTPVWPSWCKHSHDWQLAQAEPAHSVLRTAARAKTDGGAWCTRVHNSSSMRLL
jgi:hypothetical protein